MTADREQMTDFRLDGGVSGRRVGHKEDRHFLRKYNSKKSNLSY
jgi:hypothetical protein